MSIPVQQGRAVVVGASIAGLFAGRALADHFEEVILLDKEGLDGGPTPRKAVPQGNHIHAILPPTYRVIQRFMPQLVDELVDGGANIIDGGREWKFHVYGNFMARGDIGQTLIGSTRPYFEDCLRRNVSSLSNLEIKTAHRFKNWIASDDKLRMNGVAVTGPDGDVDINADLVIDARGRASTMSKEL